MKFGVEIKFPVYRIYALFISRLRNNLNRVRKKARRIRLVEFGHRSTRERQRKKRARLPLLFKFVAMARKKVREYDGKRLIVKQAKAQGVKLGKTAGRSAQVSAVQLEKNASAFYEALAVRCPWLKEDKLVVKPDMLFGKRGKNNLVMLNCDYETAQMFIADRMNTELEISGVTGTLTTFVIEPFVPHEHEYYLGIQTERDGDTVSFGACGGVDIEDNWHKVKSTLVPCGVPGEDTSIASMSSSSRCSPTRAFHLRMSRCLPSLLRPASKRTWIWT